MVNTARAAAIAAASFSLLAAFATSVAAQDENAFRAYFEGRRITLRMDMPGSSDGVDVQIEPPRAIDYKKYRENLKRYGVAIRSGDESRVTLVKLKGNLIEFQIGGGGYGTFGDDTSTSSGIRLLDKSDREKALEKRIKDESDKDRRRVLQRELDDLRDERERQNRILRAQSERIEEAKRERISEKRLQGGSRFNVRYSPKVPEGLKPEDLEKALTEYVDFQNVADFDDSQPAAAPPDLRSVKKGMLREDAERAFGKPVQRSEKREGTETITTLIFDVGDQRLTAAFVEDVLIRYSITSK
jgi:hypothetical protein